MACFSQPAEVSQYFSKVVIKFLAFPALVSDKPVSHINRLSLLIIGKSSRNFVLKCSPGSMKTVMKLPKEHARVCRLLFEENQFECAIF